MEEKDKYSSQKKYLATQKQLRVWIAPEKYEALNTQASRDGGSRPALVNHWVDQYLQSPPGE